MQTRESIHNALSHCNEARTDVLLSMAYQLGVEGVAQFKNMLSAIAKENFDEAANAMLSSLWARQTPGRARRHAEVMRRGTYDVYRGCYEMAHFFSRCPAGNHHFAAFAAIHHAAVCFTCATVI